MIIVGSTTHSHHQCKSILAGSSISQHLQCSASQIYFNCKYKFQSSRNCSALRESLVIAKLVAVEEKSLNNWKKGRRSTRLLE